MNKIFQNVPGMAFYAAMIISPCSYGEELVSVYGDWSVFMDPPGICYARGKVTASDKSEPAREENYVQVSMFPQMKWYDKVFVIPGYTYQKDSAVYVRVDDGNKYRLGQDGYKASASNADKSDLVNEMKQGKVLTVEGVSSSGHATIETYSLKNFPAAYEKVASLCNAPMKPVGEPHGRTVDAGNASVTITPPLGTVDIYKEADLIKAFQGYLDSNVLLLAGFVADTDMQRWKDGQELEYTKYAQVVMARESFGVEINQQAFKQAVELGKRMDLSMPRAFLEIDVMGNSIKLNPEIKKGESGYVEMLVDTPSVYSKVQMTNLVDGYQILTSDTVLLLRNRIFKLEITIEEVGTKQLEWLEMVTRKWITDLQVANR